MKHFKHVGFGLTGAHHVELACVDGYLRNGVEQRPSPPHDLEEPIRLRNARHEQTGQLLAAEVTVEGQDPLPLLGRRKCKVGGDGALSIARVAGDKCEG